MPRSVRGCALTVGNFDGVHLGHRKIIATARSLADRQGASAVAITFEPPPASVLGAHSPAGRITPETEKVRLLLAAGCDLVVIVTADLQFLATSPRDFIDDVLVGRFAPSHVVEGRNFLFGHRRAGSVETLAAAAGPAGFAMHVVAPVMMDLPTGRQRVSSTLVRSLIERGQVALAGRCLGRDFSLFGKVVAGTGRGAAVLGRPTINLRIDGQIVPADGIYAGRAAVDGRRYAAAISIGDNPTLGGVGRSVEAHLLDAAGEFLGKDAELSFVQAIGEQKKFDSPEALARRIAKDIEHVRQIIG